MELIRLFVVFLVTVSAMGQLLSQDILALLEFKKGIKHDPTGYVMSSWNEESVDFHGCPSSWNGIVCNGANVAEVVLDGQGLSADVNLGVLSNLTMLVKLSISRNSITGRIPKNIGNFKSLQYLDLSDNLFSFTLPSEIGKLGSLKNLSLAGNKFSGPIPESISGLASIESLDLSRNFLSGPLPLSLTKLPKLVVLNLSSNGFEKEIPKGFELMENLQILDLHGNMFDSQIDMQFFLFSSISYLDLSQNMLASSSSQGGKFLPAISETIKHMNLSHNKLTGSLVGGGGPQVFGNLKVLDLSYNQFSGELPEFNFVYDLEVLKLSSNKFSGFIPSALLKDDSLVITELDLSGNNLSGPLSMITSTNLRVVNLSSNGLSGELPLLIGGCTVLDLSNNQFEGNLTKLMKWDNIGFLDLSRNNLAGPFPEVTSQFTRLNYLNLSHNSLNSISRVLTQIPKLRVLDLSSNQLDGAILPELLTLPTLEELHLENNSLSGSLRFSPPPRKVNLRVLDLSHNQFSGYFPDLVRSMTELKVLSLAGNNLSGALPTSMAAMNSLSSFDISQNYFTGKLPPHLPKSLKSFNISYNNLSGVVPENLKTLPTSSFYPGNTRLKLPISPPGSTNHPAESFKRKPIRTFVIVGVIVACVLGFIILILLAIFIHYIRISKRPLPEHLMNKNTRGRPGSDLSGFSGRDTSEPTVVSADDIMKESPSDIISPEKKMAGTSFSPSRFSWSHDSGDSLTAEILSRLDGRSPSLLVGELHFLDDTITLTPEELSRAPAEVLGRSSRGTSYRATMENGLLLTVKWLREGVAKERKDFTKEAKKFTNIRHPNVVGLKGYYWGPTQHEKLILSDYISPGSLASFLYGKNCSPLAWIQRLRIAVDVARGLNYLHFDRALPHGNLKTTNILLEGPDLSARVADYCLHRLMTQAGAAEQILDAGALGYRAPELAASKKPFPSFKSDVYSFGVVLLELLTGRSAGSTISCEEGGVDLTEWVRLRVAEGRGSECFDPALMAEMAMPAVEKGVNEVLSIALRCVKPVSERPGIKTIYEDLSSV